MLKRPQLTDVSITWVTRVDHRAAVIFRSRINRHRHRDQAGAITLPPVVILMQAVAMGMGWFVNQFIFEQSRFTSAIDTCQRIKNPTIKYRPAKDDIQIIKRINLPKYLFIRVLALI